MRLAKTSLEKILLAKSIWQNEIGKMSQAKRDWPIVSGKKGIGKMYRNCFASCADCRSNKMDTKLHKK